VYYERLVGADAMSALRSFEALRAGEEIPGFGTRM
jgi:hypothetical protein